MTRERVTTTTRPATDRNRSALPVQTALTKAKSYTGGRPSREAAVLLGDRILDVATQLFLQDGYGQTSIEVVARNAHVSKRTIYQRFVDKPGLFRSVVHRIIERLRPPNDATLFEGEDIEKILARVGSVILDATLTPQALGLHRIMVAEANRFPDLVDVASKESAGPEAIHRISELLTREAQKGTISVADVNFVAAQFLFLIVSVPQRRALGMGTPMTARERTAWVTNSIRLLLNGCKVRT